MQSLEIEKRFLIKNTEIKHYLDLADEKSKIHMNDFYVPNGENHKDLRLREQGENYMVTRKRPIKEGDTTIMMETTIPLSREEFLALADGISTNVEKNRYRLEMLGFDGELDVLLGRLEGLAFVEFEFPDEEALAEFEKKFSGDLTDVTNVEWLASGKLAETAFQELKSKVEQL